jgi:DNA-binding MarR family transcriptional regulator
LSRLEKQKLITRKSSIEDRRQYHLGLTASGLAAFNLANERQRAQTEATLRRLSVTERKQLTAAMATIEKLLHAKSNQVR